MLLIRNIDNKPIAAPIIICIPFVVLSVFSISTGYLPTHDAIEWHGISHYFYSAIEKGTVPYWNPYSQTGTPFYTLFQARGLLEPSQFFFIFLQKLTGCTTLVTYTIYYMFLYYLFVLGTFYLIREVTRSVSIGILFAVILFLVLFPSVMRQYGALMSFYLIPFIAYFILLFFKEERAGWKGFYLLTVAFICAAAINIYIPVWLIFFVLLFVLLSFLFKIADIKETLLFFSKKQGMVWSAAAILTASLLTLPVIELYLELHHESELFPSVRLLQKNGNHLVRCYASDFEENIFSEAYSGNAKVSVTSGNLMGIIFEPFQYLFPIVQSSEIIIYFSMLPLLSVWAAIRNRNNRFLWLFLPIAILALMISCNFAGRIVTPPNAAQRMIMAIFPFLKMSDVLEIGGSLFMLCFIVCAAIGFKSMSTSNKVAVWMIPILIPFYRLTLFLFILNGYTVSAFQIIMAYLLLFISAATIFMVHNRNNKMLSDAGVRKIRQIAIVVLLVDLSAFCLFHVLFFNKVLNKRYYTYMSAAGMLEKQPVGDFENYRRPFTFSRESDTNPNILFNSFFGHEIYMTAKSAFPAVVKYTEAKTSKEGFFTLWDHMYMTKSYYDYLVNVSYEKQAITSNIVTPILTFFPEKNVIWVKNKYDAVERINTASNKRLMTHVFIERNTELNPSPKESYPASFLFNPNNFISYSQDQLKQFSQNLNLRVSPEQPALMNIIHHDINSLSLHVEAPLNGYIYFGDGYSKHWKATLDGQAVPIEKANINFKSVYTPAGQHTIEFIYDPVWYRYSLYAYGLGILLFVFICLVCLYVKIPTFGMLGKGDKTRHTRCA